MVGLTVVVLWGTLETRLATSCQRSCETNFDPTLTHRYSRAWREQLQLPWSTLLVEPSYTHMGSPSATAGEDTRIPHAALLCKAYMCAAPCGFIFFKRPPL